MAVKEKVVLVFITQTEPSQKNNMFRFVKLRDLSFSSRTSARKISFALAECLKLQSLIWSYLLKL